MYCQNTISHYAQNLYSLAQVLKYTNKKCKLTNYNLIVILEYICVCMCMSMHVKFIPMLLNPHERYIIFLSPQRASFGLVPVNPTPTLPRGNRISFLLHFYLL